MLRRQRQVRTQFQKLVDACLFAVSYWLAHLIRFHNPTLAVFGGPGQISDFPDYVWLLLIVMPVTPFLLELQGFYNRPLIPSRRRTAWQLFRGCALAVTILISVIFLTKEVTLARSVVILFGFISFCLILAKEELVRLEMETKAGQAQFKKRFILVGTSEDTARMKTQLPRSAPDGIEIVGQLNLNDTSVEQLVDLLHKHSANGVILSAKHTFFGQVEKAIQACELEGVEAWLLADFFNTQLSQTLLDDFYGRPMLIFRSTPEHSWQALAKEVFDLAAALVLLVVLLPLFLVVTLAIKLTSPGPVWFRQQRSGLNGRPFTMLKFRSMASDAEQRKHEFEALNEMDGPVFKVTDDPRITPIGRFLRRHSIDELPQLINVLRGEMSLVGPRPLPVDEVLRFDDFAHRRRLSVKPGMTCLWQVSGRNNVKNFKDWVRLDLEYIDNWSLWLDFKILFRTIPVVFSGTGAK
ncbi:MAG: sugar transferase [Verrucomicrobia bacterium]|nr:sugar transferase [Verrucomicrobiota bacterium]